MLSDCPKFFCDNITYRPLPLFSFFVWEWAVKGSLGMRHQHICKFVLAIDNILLPMYRL